MHRADDGATLAWQQPKEHDQLPDGDDVQTSGIDQINYKCGLFIFYVIDGKQANEPPEDRAISVAYETM